MAKPPLLARLRQVADRALARVGLTRVQPRTYYAGANVSRQLADWISAPITSANQEARADLMRLRARSRELARNSPVIKQWLRLAEQNVVGSVHPVTGMRLQSRVMAGKKLDAAVNALLEAQFVEWAKAASWDGRHSLRDLAMMVPKVRRMDGEVLFRKIRGRAAGNRFGFALQPIDCDQLDHTWQQPAGDGTNPIVMGVELDATSLTPVAYWLWSYHPGDPTAARRIRERIPADEILHLYRVERPGQVRGIPEAHAVMVDLHHRDGYTEAELVAARSGACNMGVLVPDPATAVVNPNERLVDGKPTPFSMEAAPATIMGMPPGYIDMKMFAAEHPVAAFGDFVKSIDRRIAQGLGVSYHSLFGDLEAVNFSSGRLGLAQERDGYMAEQHDLGAHFYADVYGEWLRMGLLMGALDVPETRIDEYRAGAIWQGRRWPSVSPKEDAETDALEIAAGFSSPQRKAAARGEDFEQNLREQAEAQRLATQYGVTLGNAPTVQKTGSPVSNPQQPGSNNGEEDAAGDTPRGRVVAASRRRIAAAHAR